MRRFQSIVVIPVTTGPEAPQALHEAVSLASSSGATVEVLALRPATSAATLDAAREAGLQLDDVLGQAIDHQIETWTEPVRHLGVPVRRCDSARPDDVAAVVAAGGYDLVMVATDGSTTSAVTARRLVGVCPGAVWLVRPNFRGARVLAAVDTEHPPEQNRLIVELARSQAEMHDGTLHVLHAWQIRELEILDEVPESVVDRASSAAWASLVEQQHREAFHELLEELGVPIDGNAHLVEGWPGRAVSGLTSLYRADLVVIGPGTHQRELGRVTEELLSEAPVSVLVAKPPP